jgi:hypothetical protein
LHILLRRVPVRLSVLVLDCCKVNRRLEKADQETYEFPSLAIPFQEHNPTRDLQLLAVVKEPGKTSSRWRIFYSLRLPSSVCDFFKVTTTIAEGNGESLNRLPYSSTNSYPPPRSSCASFSVTIRSLVARSNAAPKCLRGAGELMEAPAHLRAVRRCGEQTG